MGLPFVEARSNTETTVPAGSQRQLKILTLATVFPNSRNTTHGIFVRSRMRHVADLAKVKVIAPVPFFDYSHPAYDFMASRSMERRRQDGPLEVFQPRWLYAPLGTPLNVWCLYLRVLRIARSIHRAWPVDLVDAHFAYPDGVAAALLARSLGRPFMVTLRGNETLFGQRPEARRAMAWALRRAGRVLTVSEDLRQYAISLGVEPGRVRTVPNGIDTDRFYPRDRQQARAQYALDRETPVVLSVGSLVERKGHHRIISALRQARDRGVKAHLLIAGGPGPEGRFEQRIRETIEETGMGDHVRLLGHVSPADLPALMSAADLFCLGSNMEGWPNVVHEAQGCGAPVVATAVGGVPEMIPSDDYGFVVPPDDTSALAAALEKALTRSWDRQAISAWGQSRSWRQVALEVVEQASQIVAEAEGRASR